MRFRRRAWKCFLLRPISLIPPHLPREWFPIPCTPAMIVSHLLSRLKFVLPPRFPLLGDALTSYLIGKVA